MIYQEKIFTKEECDIIKKYGNQYSIDLTTRYKFNEIHNGYIDGNRVIFKQNDEIVTSYETHIIPNNEETEWMFNKVLSWFEKITNVKINKNEKIKDCTLHCYKTGDFFMKHVDLNPNFKDRRWNIGIQINEEYEGGNYICWDNNNEEILISKEPGTALTYYCDIWHEIKEVTNGERWSVVIPLLKNLIVEKINII
jgi:hypothetical protein